MVSPNGPRPRQDYPTTYMVQDRANKDEMTRLRVQDSMVTAGMGGVLSEQADPTNFRAVLDVGCGTGGWLIETTRTYPMISQLVGIDINDKMIKYASSQARAQQVSNRVRFHQMDALSSLAFPPASFDLVNQRLGLSYVRSWEWPGLLSEYQRITRPGAVIRITEPYLPESKRSLNASQWPVSSGLLSGRTRLSFHRHKSDS